MLQFTYKLKLLSGSRPSAAAIPATTPRKMAAPAFVAAAPPAFPSTTSTRLALRSMQRSGSSYAELGRGHGDVNRDRGRLRLRRRSHPYRPKLGDRK